MAILLQRVSPISLYNISSLFGVLLADVGIYLTGFSLSTSMLINLFYLYQKA